jgi:hypothetical protein
MERLVWISPPPFVHSICYPHWQKSSKTFPCLYCLNCLLPSGKPFTGMLYSHDSSEPALLEVSLDLHVVEPMATLSSVLMILR